MKDIECAVEGGALVEITAPLPVSALSKNGSQPGLYLDFESVSFKAIPACFQRNVIAPWQLSIPFNP
uniref:Uncharacterized protein n=1 Tax=Utricularia reniformis TaxID=192314 RepID=A0A1Y0B296_9LAMI|nr:hypothetical protein AEK19_MT1379 [Utricularia reniformis]ART31575.1 hypothetical protein AEK19_MT1379 [Utricularia reniformis]